MKIFTVGHSIRSFEEFVDLLRHYNIELVIDVRRFPSSKKFPWFKKENLEKEFQENKIEYLHYPELGGYRKEGYENFTKTKDFENALKKIMTAINEKVAAIMCAEMLWFRCHRRYIAEKLVGHGKEVMHIYSKERTDEHKLSSETVKEKMNLKIWCDKKAKKLNHMVFRQRFF